MGGGTTQCAQCKGDDSIDGGRPEGDIPTVAGLEVMASIKVSSANEHWPKVVIMAAEN